MSLPGTDTWYRHDGTSWSPRRPVGSLGHHPHPPLHSGGDCPDSCNSCTGTLWHCSGGENTEARVSIVPRSGGFCPFCIWIRGYDSRFLNHEIYYPIMLRSCACREPAPEYTCTCQASADAMQLKWHFWESSEGLDDCILQQAKPFCKRPVCIGFHTL